MDYSFYTKAEYYDTLAKRISSTQPGDRVALATMALQPDEPGVARILHELYSAARRGVTVIFMVDAFPFMIKEHIGPGPLLFLHNLPATSRLSKTFRRRMQALEQLKASGGSFGIINQPGKAFTNPFAGRSHIKCAVVNDEVFIGGCNLSTARDVDLMVGWHDANIAELLFSFVQDAIKRGSVRQLLQETDQRHTINDSTELLLDAGKAGQSVILDTALQLIDEAKEYIVLTCQYFPNDVTIAHLAAAEARGVTVKIIYNHPSKHPRPLNLLHHGVALQQRRLRPVHFFTYQLTKNHNYIHAKLIVTDAGTLIGSHNYVQAGVTFGTAEIAVLSRDPAFGKAALDVLRPQLHITANI